MRAEEFETAQEQYTYSSAKRLISRHPPLQEVIVVFFEELEGSAAGLTVSVGRNDYKG